MTKNITNQAEFEKEFLLVQEKLTLYQELIQNEKMEDLDYKFEMGTINFDKYVSGIKKLKTEYSKYPKIVKEINIKQSLLQILGVGMDTHDTMPSILLFFDRQRFIFNAGEVILGL